MISSIAVDRNYVFVSLPRMKAAGGVPWVLGILPLPSSRQPLDQAKIIPYPNWDLHAVGDCDQLQNPLAMEVDPNTHLLYVVDTGRAGVLTDRPVNACPAKIVVYKRTSAYHGVVVSTHVLPDDVVDRNSSVLTSVVLDYTHPHADTVRYAYISDAGQNKLIVHDLINNKTWSYYDSTMSVHDKENITINGQPVNIQLGLSGLAMSPDFNYLYWTSMWNDHLFQMPTWPLRDASLSVGEDGIPGIQARDLGVKVSNSDDMVHGKDSLYYGALTKDAVYRWEKRHDLLTQHVPEDAVTMTTQSQLVQNWVTMQWPDSLCLDEAGNLWFTTSRTHLFLSGNLDFNDTSTFNFRIFKLPVSDNSYLQDIVPSGPVVG